MERLKTLVIVALLVALAGSIAFAATSGEAEVRINARQLEDGRVEFALQQRVDGEWQERILPRSRYFPADATVGRWLNSTPMTVSAETTFGSTRTIRSTDADRSIHLDAGWYRAEATAVDVAGSWPRCGVSLEQEADRTWEVSVRDSWGNDDSIEYFEIGDFLFDPGVYVARGSGTDECESWSVEIARVD